MRWGWMVFWLAVPSVAWAEYQVVPGQRIDLHELTRVFKQAVPELTGCDDTWGTVTCRKAAGDFTEVERQAMDAAVAAHDPESAAKRKAKGARDRASGDAKLKALGLTEDELRARERR